MKKRKLRSSTKKPKNTVRTTLWIPTLSLEQNVGAKSKQWTDEIQLEMETEAERNRILKKKIKNKKFRKRRRG